MKQWFTGIDCPEAQTVISEGGNKWGKPYESPNLLPGLNFQAAAQGGVTLVEPGGLHELRRWIWSLEKWRRLEFTG